ncbi:tRNA-dihydrouridine synthase C [Enhygromyxa salina]|uniref:tRNA-dihydrouridine synthase n=1 Tax=Enhygromyxa salina TaxID=215803 RepID=A0A2S9XD03_9BACT|nr:tRNA-dihydrouridine synthase family protein [Enhygromyxa salina]PRP90742.1 tRNA-dihydrouridine synthase C [Enhygromyxa salina]
MSEAERVAQRPDAPGLFVALAPMDGVTDGSYREVLSALFGGRSGISLCVSEFVRVIHQPVPEAVFLRHCPELDHGGQTRAGVPVFVQLLGGEPRWMADAALVAARLGAPGIDLNFGCPAKTVNNSDGGASLLKQPRRVEAVTRAVRAVVPEAIPVTVKVRVGWDDAAAMVDIARAAEQGGASWLTIHGRTRKQLYKPPVDWRAIGRAREAVAMPVVANGDLFDLDALRRCAELSGCSAFMIGRGAMGRPELFAQARGWRTRALSTEDMRALLLAYVGQLLEDGASEHRALGRLKQWLRMGGMLRGDLGRWFEVIKRLQTLDAARQVLVAATPPCPG